MIDKGFFKYMVVKIMAENNFHEIIIINKKFDDSLYGFDGYIICSNVYDFLVMVIF